jgi:hypothetical protein
MRSYDTSKLKKKALSERSSGPFWAIILDFPLSHQVSYAHQVWNPHTQ